MSIQQGKFSQSLIRLSVGAIAILAVSAVLLAADRGSRNGGQAPKPGRMPQVALIQHASV